MKEIRITISFMIVLLLNISTGLGIDDKDSIMYVHYINVGQGDASLLEFPCGAILIDAGAQSNEYVDSLLIYLDDFFEKRNDLNRTFESVIITHNHPDHIKGIKEILIRYTVKRLIYNGIADGNGRGDLNWAIRNAVDSGYNIYPYTYEKIIRNDNKNGFSDSIIDPIKCINCDPLITFLQGGFEENPGWSHSAFDNKNNHSLVIRIDLGESSFLFTGDLEDTGIKTLLEYYTVGDNGSNSLLDVDVYRVGHHGSHNATTEEMLEIMSPEIAIISVGKWDYGKGTNNRFTTYWYGHPRKDVIKLLNDNLEKKRSTKIQAMVAKGSKDYKSKTIKKKIYATAWDKNIKVRATVDGSFRVTRNN